jgi:NADPH:quinone reductase-like Zn-dependent oxidoreductase
MKAVVFEEYGPPEVLWIKGVEKPIPRENEILVKVHATTVSQGDVKMRRPDPLLARLYNGLIRPRRITVLGFELAGVVEAAGKKVKRFKAGDAVFGFTGFGFGAYAEYICLPEEGMLALKPENLTFEGAAAGLASGAMTALIVLRKAHIQPDQRVLIYGASGSVGTYAVQLARHFGAAVTGVCSTANLEMVRSLGAAEVIDYTCEDLSRYAGQYDGVFDAVDRLPRWQGKRLLKPGGVYLNVARDSGSGGGLKLADLYFLRDLARTGEIRPVIDRCYPLEGIVDAHRYVEKGHKKGHVVITMMEESRSLH